MVRAENNYQEFESGANLYFIFSCNLAFWHPLCLIILIIIVRQEFIFLILSAVPVQSEFKQVIEFFPPFPPMKLSLSQGLLCAQRNQKKVKNQYNARNSLNIYEYILNGKSKRHISTHFGKGSIIYRL